MHNKYIVSKYNLHHSYDSFLYIIMQFADKIFLILQLTWNNHTILCVKSSIKSCMYELNAFL